MTYDFSTIPVRSNGQRVFAKWWNIIREKLIEFISDHNALSGSPASQIDITIAGITHNSKSNETIFLQGSGGAIDITADPQIANGNNINDRLLLIGSSNTNTITLQDGDGLKLNGECVLAENETLSLLWNGTIWIELGRSF